MSEEKAPTTCPECGSGYLNTRHAQHHAGHIGRGDETIRGEVGCLSCGSSWLVEQDIEWQGGVGEVEPSPFEGRGFSLGYTREIERCPRCDSQRVEAFGKVRDGMLVVLDACRNCDWSGKPRRHRLGVPRLVAK